MWTARAAVHGLRFVLGPNIVDFEWSKTVGNVEKFKWLAKTNNGWSNRDSAYGFFLEVLRMYLVETCLRQSII